jgi:hypothetical protein
MEAAAPGWAADHNHNTAVHTLHSSANNVVAMRDNQWGANSLVKCGKSVGGAWESAMVLWEKCVDGMEKSEERAAKER